MEQHKAPVIATPKPTLRTHYWYVAGYIHINNR